MTRVECSECEGAVRVEERSSYRDDNLNLLLALVMKCMKAETTRLRVHSQFLVHFINRSLLFLARLIGFFPLSLSRINHG